MERTFCGVYAALLTPFDENNKVDEGRLRRLVDFIVSKGVDGLYVCGGTGEGLLMNVAERKFVAETVKDQVKDKVTIIAHVGGSGSTENAVELAKHAETIELNGVSSIPPPYYGYRFEEIFEYYRKLGESTNLPFLIYYIPASSGISISNEQMKALGKIRNVIGLKYASLDLYTLQDLLLKMEGKWAAFSGADELCLPALTVGVVGCIGSTQNVLPELFVELYRNFEGGKIKEAMKLQERISTAVSLLLKYGRLASWKTAARFRGVDAGHCRPPFKKRLSAEEENAFLKEWKSQFPEFCEGSV